MTDLHPDAKVLVESLIAAAPPDRTVPAARQRTAMLTRRVAAGPSVAHVTSLVIDGPRGPLALRHYQPSEETVAVMLYFHGGGWVTGDLETSDALCRILAVRSGCDVLSVEYALAPEEPFPCALEDGWAALGWARAHFGSGVALAIGGDSSGANLAAVIAQRARDAGGPELAMQFLAYPITDAAMESASYRQHANGPGSLTAGSMSWYFDQYLPPAIDPLRADVSPIRAADLHGLPPAHVIVAEFDPLRDDGLDYAAALQAAGVSASVDYRADMGHGFCMLIGLLDAAEDAANRAADHMSEVLATFPVERL